MADCRRGRVQSGSEKFDKREYPSGRRTVEVDSVFKRWIVCGNQGKLMPQQPSPYLSIDIATLLSHAFHDSLSIVPDSVVDVLLRASPDP